MNKLAFGYVRRSSYKQQENNSVEIQKAHIQEFAHRKGMEVPDEFIFIEVEKVTCTHDGNVQIQYSFVNLLQET